MCPPLYGFAVCVRMRYRGVVCGLVIFFFFSFVRRLQGLGIRCLASTCGRTVMDLGHLKHMPASLGTLVVPKQTASYPNAHTPGELDV